MLDQPSTREEEVLRQQKMLAIRDAAAGYNREFNACHIAVTYGEAPGTPKTLLPPAPPFPLPTDDELREKVRQDRQRIAQIDRELAPHKSDQK